MGDYRISATLRLTIRLEELGDGDLLRGLLPMPDFDSSVPDPFSDPVPPSSSTSTAPMSGDEITQVLLDANQGQMAALVARRDDLSREEYDRRMARLVEEREELTGEIERGSDDDDPLGALAIGSAPPSVAAPPPDDLTILADIPVISAQIERNGLAQADTASMDIPWSSFPVDPRIIRAASCVLTIGVVPPEDFEAGMERGETREDGSLVSVIQSSGEIPTRHAATFYGFVDKWGSKYGSDGETLSLQCRDMSAPIRDAKLGTNDRIDLTLPIDEGVRSFLDSLGPTTRGIEVVYRGSGDPPTPGTGASTRRRTRRGRNARRETPGGNDSTAWDHITDVVRALGLLPIMRGYFLVIQDPRTLYSTEETTRMVYGRNISDLDFERSLQGERSPTIEVRCYDPDRGRTIWGRYPVVGGGRASGVVGIDSPPQPSRASAVTPSGANPDDTVQTYSVSGITDPERLVTIAQSTFEQIGRHEIQGRFETEDPDSYGIPGEGRMFTLQAGHAVEILMATCDDSESTGVETTQARLQAMSRARRSDYLISMGFERRVAERLSALQDATGFQTVFRVSRVSINFSSDDGVKSKVDFINYIEVREQEQPTMEPTETEVVFDDDDVVTA